jgi:hypothetical protein
MTCLICYIVGVNYLLGRKVLRFCFVKNRKVVCDGLCHVTFSVVNGNGAKAVHICSLWEDAFDLAMNCR